MRPHRIVALALIVAAAALLLAGCGDRSTPTAQPGAVRVLRATDQVDQRGWQARIVIVLDGTDVIAVDYDEFDADGNRKTLDDAYTERWAAQFPGMSPAYAKARLEAQLVERNSAGAVDTVTGATSTTARFKAVAAGALGN